MDYNHIIASLYQIASDLSAISDSIWEDLPNFISSEKDKELVEEYTRVNEAKEAVLTAIRRIAP